MSTHPYDGAGGCGCTSLLIRVLAWVALLFGIALMATPFYGETDIPAEMRGMSWSLAFFGLAAVLLGLAWLLDVKVKSDRTPTYRSAEGKIDDPMAVAEAYYKKHVRNNLSPAEIAGLGDSTTFEWAQFRCSHSTGQVANGTPIYFTVGADAWGEIVGAAYHYEMIGIGPSSYPPEWLN